MYVVINIDVAPDHAAEGRAVLVEEGRLSRLDAGFMSWQLLQRTDRDNHLAIVEAWSSDADFDRHVETDHARATRQTAAADLGLAVRRADLQGGRMTISSC